MTIENKPFEDLESLKRNTQDAPGSCGFAVFNLSQSIHILPAFFLNEFCRSVSETVVPVAIFRIIKIKY